MRRIGLILLVIAFSMSSLPSGANAERRVALVIGNSAYQHTGKLTNPKNDASDVAAALKKLGFQVLDAFDLDKAAFDRKIRDFAAALQGAEAGLFFFAGHGLQVADQNYLVPVDAKLRTASALDFEMVRVDLVQRVMEDETHTNVLFLDACRDNPLAGNLARALGTRSSEVGRGLALPLSRVGSLISFSTQPGNVAQDGTGRNSPFAGALVKRLAAPKDDLSAILIDVRQDVMRETQGRQIPWEHSALRGRFYFGPAPATLPPSAVQIPPAFSCGHGRFEKVGSDKWVKLEPSSVAFRFKQSGVSDGYLYLRDDPSSNPAAPLTIRIPLAGGMAQWGYPNPIQWQDLFVCSPTN
jgi:uncharacterized caspase-like protein